MSNLSGESITKYICVIRGSLTATDRSLGRLAALTTACARGVSEDQAAGKRK